MSARVTNLRCGARVVPGGVQFTVWAPKARRVDVAVETPGGVAHHPLMRVPAGYFTGIVSGAGVGARYTFRLDDSQTYPDPCSRFQPDGVHGPSEVIDPAAFPWSDDNWPGIGIEAQVIYELHVGTFTPKGTFAALTERLPYLRDLGVTAIELMPVAAFPGRWNWGYDGVSLYAPSQHYGRPDDLRRLVDAAHGHGLAVILDAVYNHLGPDGNYLRAFSDHYFTDRHSTPWGDAIDYDGPHSRPVREFVIGSALAWIRDYHIDGLRLDATHAIRDENPEHLLAELARRARHAVGRGIVLIAEDDRNEVRLIQSPADGGFGLDAVWADDFHHQVRVLLTGERHAYFADHAGTAAEVAGALEKGFVYQGQPTVRTGRARGTRVTDEPAAAFVFCIQNHDQVGNRAFGERLDHVIDPALAKAATALLLFAPETPMLWMGEEFHATSPFLYFTDHHRELGKLVSEGRRREFRALFPESGIIPDPQDPATFFRSKLDFGERIAHAPVERLYRALLALRRVDPVLRTQDRQRLHAVALSDRVLAVHRWVGADHRLLLANFGPAQQFGPLAASDMPELFAHDWTSLLSTTDLPFGGDASAFDFDREPAIWRLPVHAAAIFTAHRLEFAR
ncbi:MAG: malto-oligosyltrehalose trehalohydrolase [Thermomicrobiales bacterium]|nr:malto-oligosyltrehalose trehalohydrolase [Thermomicrobiales bacterium]